MLPISAIEINAHAFVIPSFVHLKALLERLSLGDII